MFSYIGIINNTRKREKKVNGERGKCGWSPKTVIFNPISSNLFFNLPELWRIEGTLKCSPSVVYTRLRSTVLFLVFPVGFCFSAS